MNYVINILKIEKHSRPNDFVVDPFLGSGTTAIACTMTRRKFAGCDSDPDCIEIIKQRLEGTKKQKK